MAPLVEGLGFDWCVDSVAKCIQELVTMTRPHNARTANGGELDFSGNAWAAPAITLAEKSIHYLQTDHIPTVRPILRLGWHECPRLPRCLPRLPATIAGHFPEPNTESRSSFTLPHETSADH
jgi:hypothetical protein